MDRDALLLKAALLNTTGWPEDAFAALEDLQDLYPDDTQVMLARASFLLDHRDAAEDALPILEELAALHRESPPSNDEDRALAAEALVLLSDARATLRDAPGALAAAEEAARAEPRDASAHLAVARAHLDLGSHREALAAVARAEKVVPGDRRAAAMAARIRFHSGVAGADRELAALAATSPEHAAAPVLLEPAELARTLQGAISRLSSDAAPLLAAVELRVADTPSPADTRDRDPAVNAGVLVLGPVPPAPKEGDLARRLPAFVTLYRRNVALAVTRKEDVADVLLLAFLQACAVHAGMNEEDMEAWLTGA